MSAVLNNQSASSQCYRYFDRVLMSNFMLPELCESEERDAAIMIELSDESVSFDNLHWSYHWRTPEGYTSISFAHTDESYVLHFPGCGYFEISNALDQVKCYPLQGTDIAAYRHLLLDQVIPRVIAHKGHVVMHASAVKVQHKMVLFLGAAGAGKSTLASHLFMEGYPLLTDDCVLLQPSNGAVTGVASYAGIRLWEDSLQSVINENSEIQQSSRYFNKQRLTFTDRKYHHVNHAIPVCALIVLDARSASSANTEIKLERLPGVEGIAELIRNTFVLDVHDKVRAHKMFNALVDIALSQTPVYRLQYIHDYSVLNEVCAIIQNELCIHACIQKITPEQH